MIAGVDVSLFRLSLLLAVGVLLGSTRGQLSSLIQWIRHPLVAAYLLIAGVVVLAMLVHPINPFLGKREAAEIGIGVIALATFAELARRESAERAASAIVVGSVLPILAAAWQGLAHTIGASEALPLLNHLPAAPGLEVTRQALASFGPIGARAKGTFGDPNHFGVYLVFVVCLAGALTVMAGRRGNRRDQVSFGAIAVAASATLVATFSRSAWIAALGSVLVIAVVLVQAWRTGTLTPPKKRVTGLVIFVALALCIPVAPSVVERLVPSSAINVHSDREHGRTVRFAFDQFIDHPVLGIGPGGLGVKLHEGARTSGAHSTYLTVAAELGIVGILALLLAVEVTLRLLIHACRRLRGTYLAPLAIALAAAYVGFLAANVTYDIWLDDDFQWIMLGAVAAIAISAGAATGRPETDAPDGVDIHEIPHERGPGAPVVSPELFGADSA